MTATTGTDLVVVDSSGWIEFFGEGPKAQLFDPYLMRGPKVLLPTIILYEVFKKLVSTRGEHIADRFLSDAYRRTIIDLDASLAIAAALNSIEKKLSMADAIVYTTAFSHSALLVTTDTGFSGLSGVKVI